MTEEEVCKKQITNYLSRIKKQIQKMKKTFLINKKDSLAFAKKIIIQCVSIIVLLIGFQSVTAQVVWPVQVTGMLLPPQSLDLEPNYYTMKFNIPNYF